MPHSSCSSAVVTIVPSAHMATPRYLWWIGGWQAYPRALCLLYDRRHVAVAVNSRYAAVVYDVDGKFVRHIGSGFVGTPQEEENRRRLRSHEHEESYYKSLGIACSAHDEIVVGRVRSDGAGGGLAIFNAHSGETLPSSSNYPSLITEICHKGFAG
jgi:hypothetical protein